MKNLKSVWKIWNQLDRLFGRVQIPCKYAKNIVVIDCETTGTNAGYHESFEWGAILVDGHTFESIGELCWRHKILYPERATSKAMKVNGQSLEELSTLPMTEAQFVKSFHSFFIKSSSIRLCAWNAGFDVAFLKAAYERTGYQKEWEEIDHHIIDLWTIFDYYNHTRLNGSNTNWLGITGAAKALNIEIPKDLNLHRALDDCKIEYLILKKLFQI